MTSQSSSINPGRGSTSRCNLLVDTLKRRWTTGLLLTLIYFFTLPVPLLMIISSGNYNCYYIADGTYIDRSTAAIHDMQSWANVMRAVMIPVVSILAVVMSCVMLRYLHSRVQVDFYHSLPITRERLLTNNLLAGFILLVVPFILMVAVSGVIIAINGWFSSELARLMLRMIFEPIHYALVYYALATLIGVVTGVTAVHLLLTGVAVFIVPAFYAALVAFASIFNENMWTSWYFGDFLMSKLSPVISFFMDVEAELPFHSFITYLIASALMLFGAYLIYRRYRSERAGCTMIFPILGVVIKYMLMALMTIAGGLLFYGILGSFFWTIFGMVCGAVLTFMLVNTIINKSAKAMFSGLRGLAIFSGTAVVCMVILLTNFLGINTRIPSLLSSVELSLDDNTTLFTFRDKEVMAAVKKMYESQNWETNKGSIAGKYEIPMTDVAYETPDDIGEKIYYSSEMFELRINVVFKPIFGIPQAKAVTLYAKHELVDELRILLDSKEFRDQYVEMLRSVSAEEIESLYSYRNYNGLSVNFNSPMFDGEPTYPQSVTDKSRVNFWRGLMPAISSDFASVGFDTFQQTQIGYETLSTNVKDFGEYFSAKRIAIPYILGHDNVYKHIVECGYLDCETPDELVTAYADALTSLEVYDIESGTLKTFTSRTDRREILSSVATLNGDAWDPCQLTVIDPRYVVSFHIDAPNYSSSTVTGFLYGRVPECVTEAFE